MHQSIHQRYHQRCKRTIGNLGQTGQADVRANEGDGVRFRVALQQGFVDFQHQPGLVQPSELRHLVLLSDEGTDSNRSAVLRLQPSRLHTKGPCTALLRHFTQAHIGQTEKRLWKAVSSATRASAAAFSCAFLASTSKNEAGTCGNGGQGALRGQSKPDHSTSPSGLHRTALKHKASEKERTLQGIQWEIRTLAVVIETEAHVLRGCKLEEVRIHVAWADTFAGKARDVLALKRLSCGFGSIA